MAHEHSGVARRLSTRVASPSRGVVFDRAPRYRCGQTIVAEPTILRRLEATDHAELLALWSVAGLACKPSGRDSRAEFERQLGLEQLAFFGLFENGRMIGSALGTHDGRKGWVNRVAVHPSHRRCGHGHRLIQACEQWLAASGIEIFACLIEGWNEASRQTVLAAGYQPFEGIGYFTKRLRPDV